MFVARFSNLFCLESEFPEVLKLEFISLEVLSSNKSKRLRSSPAVNVMIGRT